MASVTTKTVPPIVPVVEYVLTLSEKEAQTVFALIGRATGSTEYSKRKYSDRIYYALENGYSSSVLVNSVFPLRSEPMATAEKVPANYKVTLTLNQNEVETLRRLLSKVGGDSQKSRRRFINSIASALHMAGVNYVDVRFDPQFSESLGFGNEDVKDNA
jgi:hypothetical protein